MKQKIISKQNRIVGIAIIVAVILIFPLFSLPRPTLVTGHPWKVEFITSIFLLASLVWLGFNSHQKNLVSKMQFNRQAKLVIILLLAFVMFSGISLFWANSSYSVAHHSFNWLLFAVLFIGFVQHFKESKSYKLVITLFSLVSSIIFFIALLDYVSAQDFTASVKTIRIRYAKYAELLLIIAPVLWSLANNVKNKKFLALYLCAGSFAWMTVMFSLSKGAFIAGVAGFILLFIGTIFFSKQRYRKKAAFIAIFWLALTVSTQTYFSNASEIPSTAQYISGDADNDRSSSQFRVFSWKITLQMIADNPILGVGADNFGREINKARKQYVVNNPNDPQNVIAENFMVERSHNEFLQILAELGIVGFLIFLSSFLYLAYWIIKSFIVNKCRFSPILFGSIAGIFAFFISSQFSSFSFRATQNGIVFFIVLAILVNELSKLREFPPKEKAIRPNLPLRKLALATSVLLVCLASISFAAQGLSNHFVLQAQSERDLIESEKLINRALWLNRENGSAYLNTGMKLYSEEKYVDAIPQLQNAVNNGLGVTVIYYYLVQSQKLSGNTKAAEKTLAEVLEIFPHSIYARTHYAILLKENGKTEQASNEFALAAKLNKKEARGWKLMFEESVLAATLDARDTQNSIAPEDLSPQNVVSAVFAAEELREERQKKKLSKK